MSGAVPLLPICALMAWTEMPLPFMIGCTVGEEQKWLVLSEYATTHHLEEEQWRMKTRISVSENSKWKCLCSEWKWWLLSALKRRRDIHIFPVGCYCIKADYVAIRINVKGNSISVWELLTISVPSLAARLIILGVLVFCIFISFLVNWKQLMKNFTYNMWGVKT